MPFTQITDKTKEQLAKLKKRFSKEAESIFKETYLRPYDGSHKENLYALPIERPTHGARHASRVAAYIPILINFCKEIGYPEEVFSITEEEITLLQLAALFHDSARKNDNEDIWEKESADLFKEYLKKKGMGDDPAALRFSRYISRQEKDFFNLLLETADSLDIMRCKKSLQLEKTPLFTELRKPKDRLSFINLADSIRQLLSDQQDLEDGCVIKFYDHVYLSAIPKKVEQKNTNSKELCELSKNCYKNVTSDFYRYPLLSKQNLPKQDVVIDVADNDEKTPSSSSGKNFFETAEFLVNSRNKTVTLLFQKEEEAIATMQFIREKLSNYTGIKNIEIFKKERGEYNLDLFCIQIDETQRKILFLESVLDIPRQKPSGDFVIKSLRSDWSCFAPSYIEMVVPVGDVTKSYPLRRTEKKSFTVTGENVFQREIKETEFFEENEHKEEKEKGIFSKMAGWFSTQQHEEYTEMVAIEEGFSKSSPLLKGEKIEEKTEVEVDAEGKVIPLKKPQYSEEEKRGFSKAMPASLGTLNYWPHVFIFSTGASMASAGVIFEIQSASPKKNILFSQRCYLYDGGTVGRLYDFFEYRKAKNYFDANKGHVLFSSNEEDFALFKDAISEPKNRNGYNEVLVRQRWTIDQDCKIFIGNRSVESVFQALEYARLFKKYLIENQLADESYVVPILFYTPNDLAFHFKPYTILTHSFYKQDALLILDDKKLRMEKYHRNEYQFLFAFKKEEIERALREMVVFRNNPKHKETLMDRLLHTGYIHIISSLADRLNFSMAEMVENFSKISAKTTSPFAWYNLLRTGNHEAAEILLQRQKKINFNECDSNGNGILHFAVKMSDHTVVGKILKKGADPNLKDDFGKTALFYATSCDNIKILRVLLQCKKIKLNIESNGKTAVDNAVLSGNLVAVKMLIKKDAKTARRKKTLYLAAEHGHTKIVQYLIEHGADVNGKWNEETALVPAIKNGHSDIIRFLLKNGACTDSEIHEDNHTIKKNALRLAIEANQIESVRALLDHETEQNTKPIGKTESIRALHVAASRGHLKIVEALLVEYGIEVDIAYYDDGNAGETALIKAVKNNRPKIVEFLLQKGADIRSPFEKNGENILHLAIKEGHSEVVELLVKHEISKYGLSDERSLQLLLLAITCGHKNVVDVLLQNNINPSVPLEINSKYEDILFKRGDTPFYIAFRLDQKKIAKAIFSKLPCADLPENTSSFPLIESKEENKKELLSEKFIMDRVSSYLLYNPDLANLTKVSREVHALVLKTAAGKTAENLGQIFRNPKYDVPNKCCFTSTPVSWMFYSFVAAMAVPTTISHFFIYFLSRSTFPPQKLSADCIQAVTQCNALIPLPSYNENYPPEVCVTARDCHSEWDERLNVWKNQTETSSNLDANLVSAVSMTDFCFVALFMMAWYFYFSVKNTTTEIPTKCSMAVLSSAVFIYMTSSTLILNNADLADSDKRDSSILTAVGLGTLSAIAAPAIRYSWNFFRNKQENAFRGEEGKTVVDECRAGLGLEGNFEV